MKMFELLQTDRSNLLMDDDKSYRILVCRLFRRKCIFLCMDIFFDNVLLDKL